MKAILIFKLPEDKFDFECACKGAEYLFALKDIREYLREELKWGEHKDGEFEMLEKMEKEFFNIIEERNINLDIE